MKELVGNVLILQMGKPSAMTNVVLAELVKKALNYESIEEIYGCFGSLQGLLNEQFIDLAGQAQKNILNLIGSPGAALKTLDKENFDASKSINIFQKQNIRYLFVIGDSSSISYCRTLNSEIQKNKYDMSIILIPTSSRNDIPLTDHCLGYGSMAKHLAVMCKSIFTEIQSRQKNGSITILELKNCDDEWLLSSVALSRGRKDNPEAPHLVIFSNFDEGTFVTNVSQNLRNFGSCVIAVGSKLTNMKGEILGGQRTSAEYIKFIAEANFDIQIEIISLQDWELTSCMTLSATDVLEAALCAQKAMELAVTVGISGKMVTLLRANGMKYSSEANCVDFENIPDKKKEFPEAWYSCGEMALDVPFFKYSSPLIAGEVRPNYENGLPIFSNFK